MERVDLRTWLLTGLAAAIALILFWKFLLPVFLPFLIGLIAAAAAEPAIRLLIQRAHFSRGPAAALTVVLLYSVLGAGLFLLLRRGLFELGALSGALPEMLSQLSAPAARLQQWLEQLATQIPDGLGEILRTGIDNFFYNGQDLVSQLCQTALNLVSTALTRLPAVFFFLVTAILSSFMIAAELPWLRTRLQEALPVRWSQQICSITSVLKRALGGWCIAQLKLMGITFLLLTFGLMILQFPYALLFGLLIAILDALPLFGTGTVLIPWSLIQFLQHNLRCGIGLLILYGVTALTRTVLEPRLLGRQVGLNPLITLFALYAGYRFLGVGGMILFPILAILLRQLLHSLHAE